MLQNATAPPGEIIEVVPVRPSEAERTWALAAHLGTLVLWIIAPLIALLTKGQDSAFVRAQAVESLNFQLTTLLALLASAALSMVGIGLLLLPTVVIGALLMVLWASVRAYQGRAFRYPMNIRFFP